jgi:hypothetical protein
MGRKTGEEGIKLSASALGLLFILATCDITTCSVGMKCFDYETHVVRKKAVFGRGFKIIVINREIKRG